MSEIFFFNISLSILRFVQTIFEIFRDSRDVFNVLKASKKEKIVPI